MAFIAHTDQDGNAWTLRDAFGYAVNEGTTLHNFRGESAVIEGGRPPWSLSSTLCSVCCHPQSACARETREARASVGRVWTTKGEFLPDVYGLVWRLDGEHPLLPPIRRFAA